MSPGSASGKRYGNHNKRLKDFWAFGNKSGRKSLMNRLKALDLNPLIVYFVRTSGR
jgi:hypothetical protein